MKPLSTGLLSLAFLSLISPTPAVRAQTTAVTREQGRSVTTSPAKSLSAERSSGTFQGVADNDEEGEVSGASPISGTYSIASNGYGSLSIPRIDSPDISGRPGENFSSVSALEVYMTDPTLNLNDPNNTLTGLGGALVVDMDAQLLGTGVLIPQIDTSATSFAGNYAFGARDFFGSGEGSWEFDLIGQGSVTGGVWGGTGLVNDPGGLLSKDGIHSGVTFGGIATPDGVNAGRYTIPLAITLRGSDPTNLTVVIYQASGAQLLWMDENEDGMSLGSLQQQGSLTGQPALNKAEAKLKPK